MPNITLEQIDLIVERTNASFTDARAALEEANGDIVEALLILERQQKSTPKVSLNKKQMANDAKNNVKDFLAKLHATRFILRKKEMTYVNVPLSVAILAVILSFHCAVVAFIIVLICGIKIEFKGNNDFADKLNKLL